MLGREPRRKRRDERNVAIAYLSLLPLKCPWKIHLCHGSREKNPGMQSYCSMERMAFSKI
jgi:hypothetical protein